MGIWMDISVARIWGVYERIFRGYVFGDIDDAEKNPDFALSYVMAIINIFSKK